MNLHLACALRHAQRADSKPFTWKQKLQTIASITLLTSYMLTADVMARECEKSSGSLGAPPGKLAKLPTRDPPDWLGSANGLPFWAYPCRASQRARSYGWACRVLGNGIAFRSRYRAPATARFVDGQKLSLHHLRMSLCGRPLDLAVSLGDNLTAYGHTGIWIKSKGIRNERKARA